MSHPGICLGCLTHQTNLKLCTLCQKPCFCNQECQTVGWRIHKDQCWNSYREQRIEEFETKRGTSTNSIINPEIISWMKPDDSRAIVDWTSAYMMIGKYSIIGKTISWLDDGTLAPSQQVEWSWASEWPVDYMPDLPKLTKVMMANKKIHYKIIVSEDDTSNKHHHHHIRIPFKMVITDMSSISVKLQCTITDLVMGPNSREKHVVAILSLDRCTSSEPGVSKVLHVKSVLHKDKIQYVPSDPQDDDIMVPLRRNETHTKAKLVKESDSLMFVYNPTGTTIKKEKKTITTIATTSTTIEQPNISPSLKPPQTTSKDAKKPKYQSIETSEKVKKDPMIEQLKEERLREAEVNKCKFETSIEAKYIGQCCYEQCERYSRKVMDNVTFYKLSCSLDVSFSSLLSILYTLIWLMCGKQCIILFHQTCWRKMNKINELQCGSQCPILHDNSITCIGTIMSIIVIQNNKVTHIINDVFSSGYFLIIIIIMKIGYPFFNISCTRRRCWSG
jgi:hypothetical protein